MYFSKTRMSVRAQGHGRQNLSNFIPDRMTGFRSIMILLQTRVTKIMCNQKNGVHLQLQRTLFKIFIKRFLKPNHEFGLQRAS